MHGNQKRQHGSRVQTSMWIVENMALKKMGDGIQNESLVPGYLTLSLVKLMLGRAR
jgi:hypothetical protein